MVDNPETTDQQATSKFSGAELARKLESSQPPEITLEEASEAYQEWLDTLLSPDRSEEDDKKLRMIDLYIQGVNLADQETAASRGESAEEFSKMLAGLDPAVRAGAQAMHEQSLARVEESDSIEKKIALQVPELLEGKLPPEAAKKVEGPYAIAVNTSGPDELNGAVSYLEEMNGIPLLNYNIDQRFLITDSTTESAFSSRIVSEGYFGHDRGRYIVAIPVAETTVVETGEAPRVVAATDYDDTDKPADFFVEAPPTGRGPDRAVNPKYVVGFIDDDSVWHPNESFMTEEPPFSSTEAGDFL